MRPMTNPTTTTADTTHADLAIALHRQYGFLKGWIREGVTRQFTLSDHQFREFECVGYLLQFCDQNKMLINIESSFDKDGEIEYGLTMYRYIFYRQGEITSDSTSLFSGWYDNLLDPMLRCITGLLLPEFCKDEDQ